MGYFNFQVFSPLSKAFCQHLTCLTWKDNEIVVIIQSSKDLLNFVLIYLESIYYEHPTYKFSSITAQK